MAVPPADPAARLAAIVASADDAIISKDLNGFITSWNPAAERMFGYTAEEAVGKNIRMIIPAERQGEEDFVLSRIRQGLPVEHYETVRCRKDGSYIEVSLSVSPIRDSENGVIGASKIARDVTEQRRLRHMAEEASRMKDEFLAVLSHELRTPLNTVLGYARMLRTKNALPDDQRDRALAVLERNAEALARLIDDVLDTSRVVTGKMRLSREPITLRQMIDDAVETVAPTADAKGVELRVEDAPLLELAIDRNRMRQVLWNLLTNAIKFTPPGGEIRVRAHSDAAQVFVEIEDTGAGIAPEHINLIFQRFWQVERGASREMGGLGIGLALARHLVELHGGQLSATSAGLGSGSTFTIRLPLAMGAPRAATA